MEKAQAHAIALQQLAAIAAACAEVRAPVHLRAQWYGFRAMLLPANYANSHQTCLLLPTGVCCSMLWTRGEDVHFLLGDKHIENLCQTII